MTQPRDLFYELYVFGQYKNVLEYVKMALELKSTYEQDLELLKSDEIHWKAKMGITYRSERKSIIKNQLNPVEKVIGDLEALTRHLADSGKDAQS